MERGRTRPGETDGTEKGAVRNNKPLGICHIFQLRLRHIQSRLVEKYRPRAKKVK